MVPCPSRHAAQIDLVRTAAKAKFDEILSGLRVSPDVGKQMMDALQVRREGESGATNGHGMT